MKPHTHGLFSPLIRTIILVNLITLLIPVLGFIYLTDYRRELISVELNSLRNETRLFAMALSEGAVVQYNNGVEVLQLGAALNILRRLASNSNKRAVLFLRDGTLLLDTRSMQQNVIARPLQADPWQKFWGKTLKRLHTMLDHWEAGSLPPEYFEPMQIDIRLFPHAMKSLSGNTDHKIWRLPPDGLMLSVAAPVQPMHQIYGSVMLFNSTRQVNQTIHDLRINIMLAFLFALLFSVTSSYILGRRLAQPLSQLAAAARKFDRFDGSLSELEIPIVKTPNDEIGALSRAMAQMTDSLKERINSIEGFAADVAHEIRNPIAAVQSVLETLPLVKSSVKKQELLDIARQELSRIDRMISDILEASRLDTALQDERRDIINIAEEIRQFLKYYCAQYPDPEMIVQIDPTRAKVAMKVSRLGQILQNLLDNARDFAPVGSPLEVNLSHDKESIVIVVGDYGAGIPESAQEKIFDRFYSDRQETKTTSHTGLGLSIVQQIVDSHGGTICVKNRPPPNSGALFRIRLPITRK